MSYFAFLCNIDLKCLKGTTGGVKNNIAPTMNGKATARRDVFKLSVCAFMFFYTMLGRLVYPRFTPM